MIVQPFSFLSGAAGGGGGIPTTNLQLDVNPALQCYTDIGQTTLATNGDDVASIENQGSSSFPFEQSNAADQPEWYSSDSSANNKPYLLFFEHNMLSTTSNGEQCLRSDDCTFYVVSNLDSQASSFSTLLNKDNDWDWDNGWRIGFDSQEDLITNVGGSTAFGGDNELENTQTTTSSAQVYTLRFKASATPYENRNYSSYLGGNEETGTSVGFNVKNTASRQIVLGASWNSSGNGTSFEWDGRIFRILGYSEYHDDTTHNSIISELETIYGI